MFKATKKIKKGKNNAGRPPTLQINIEHKKITLQELKNNPRLVYSLEIPTKIDHLIFKYKSQSFDRRITNNENTNRIFTINEYPNRQRYTQQNNRGKTEFFNFMTLILETSSSYLGLNDDFNFQSILSTCLESFVDKMLDLNVKEIERDKKQKFKSFKTDLLNELSQNAEFIVNISNYFAYEFCDELLKIFESSRKFFITMCEGEDFV